MGILACKSNNHNNSLSVKLYKIKSEEYPQHPSYSHSDLSSPNTFSLYTYDIESKKGKSSQLDIRILSSLQGLTELTFNNILYLCGSPKADDIGSSFLIRVEHDKKPLSATLLISTINHHYYPSMIGIKNDKILVVGGKHQKSCEFYSIVNEKWKQITDLPDERYQCSLCYDNQTENVYLFGGYNEERDKLSQTILKIQTKYFIQWETIIIKEEYCKYIERLSPLLYFNGLDSIIIFGGKDKEGKNIENIIQYKVPKKECVVLKEGVHILCKHHSMEEKENDIFIFDDEFNIVKINKNTGEILSIPFEEVLPEN